MSETKLNCSYNLAGVLLIALGIGFLIVGCAGLYGKLGLSPEQIERQTIADQQLVEQAITGGRELVWQIATVAVSGIGAILAGLLGKWLKVERTISTAMIQGVEKADKSTVKESIERSATALGVEAQLHKRVQALTS